LADQIINYHLSQPVSGNPLQAGSNQKLFSILHQNTKKQVTMGNKKLQVWLPLIFSMVLIGGMFFGFKLRENTPSGNGFFRTDRKTALHKRSLCRFGKIRFAAIQRY
jgi:hypothetical protein